MLIGGWAMVPWIILANASTFLNFMSAYAVFMAPIAGIMLTDYWFIKKRKIDVPALYDPEGIYGKCVSTFSPHLPPRKSRLLIERRTGAPSLS
jgi:cytosine/uracil/thiamine/allantoin permease